MSLLAQGVSWDALLSDYPDLEPDDIRACLAYARAVIPAEARIALTELVLQSHAMDLASGAIVTVRGTRIRVSRSDV